MTDIITFDLVPYSSIGSIVVNQKRDVVRSLFDCKVEEFYKTPLSSVPTDEMVGKNLHVFYDDEFSCKGVEIFKPNRVVVDGKNILNEKTSLVKEALVSSGCEISLESSVLECNDLGLSLYIPDLDEDPDALVESVYVYLINKL
jgi:hypothetical protein